MTIKVYGGNALNIKDQPHYMWGSYFETLSCHFHESMHCMNQPHYMWGSYFET